jgi:disulfide bond formation protein DsbB
MLLRLPQTRTRWLELLTVGNAAFVIAGVGFASLAAAWLFQLMGFEPCELCYAERNAYYFAVPTGLIAAMLADRAPKAAALLLAAACVALIFDAGLAAYHAGVEWHFWPGPDACTGDGAGVSASSSLSEKLRHNTAVVRCDVAAIRIFGISLAGYLVFLSLGLAGLGGAALHRARQAGTL